MIKAAKIQEWKKKEIEEIRNLINKYSILGIVDLTNLPAPQLYSIKTKLKDTLLLKLSKKRLIKIALDQLKESKKNIALLNEDLIGIPAVIFTNESPFKLYKHLAKAKTVANAKAGQLAPKDIIISPGPTPFTPGPIISELGRFGIKTAVEEGKIIIKNEVIAVREGEVIKREIADLLVKLGIKPMVVGLNLVSVYDRGFIYKKDVLSFDDEAYKVELKKAYGESLALALKLGYITKDTVSLLIKKAYLNAKSLSGSRKIETKEEKEEVIVKQEVKTEKKREVKTEEEKTNFEEKNLVEEEKKPSTNEMLKEIEEEEKKSGYKELKEAEKIAKQILTGGT